MIYPGTHLRKLLESGFSCLILVTYFVFVFRLLGQSNETGEIDAIRRGFSKTIKATAKAVIGKGFFRLPSLQKHVNDI